jgi:hypothetical protein
MRYCTVAAVGNLEREMMSQRLWSLIPALRGLALANEGET